MFNGNINNKHYTNADEYYRDLNELIRNGKNYTASCSISTCNDEEEKYSCENEVKNDAMNYEELAYNLTDLDSILKMKHDKFYGKDEEFFEILKGAYPYEMTEPVKEGIKMLNEDERNSLKDIIERKLETANREKASFIKQIENIDRLYDDYQKQREAAYNKLKTLNEVIESFARNRNNYEENLDILEYCKSQYLEYLDEIDKNSQETKSQPIKKEPVDNGDSGETITMNDLFNSFKELYSKLLN